MFNYQMFLEQMKGNPYAAVQLSKMMGVFGGTTGAGQGQGQQGQGITGIVGGPMGGVGGLGIGVGQPGLIPFSKLPFPLTNRNPADEK